MVKKNENQPDTFMAAVDDYTVKNGCSKADAVRACAEIYPQLHEKMRGERFGVAVLTDEQLKQQFEQEQVLRDAFNSAEAYITAVRHPQRNFTGFSGPVPGAKKREPATFMAAVDDYIIEHGCSRASAVRVCADRYPGLHEQLRHPKMTLATAPEVEEKMQAEEEIRASEFEQYSRGISCGPDGMALEECEV